MMNYIKPNKVVSPRDFIKNVNVLFDGGINSFSIAELEWEGGKSYGMRWNVARREWDDPEKLNGNKICMGMPTSRAYPVWFILPNATTNYIQEIIEEEKKQLKKRND